MLAKVKSFALIGINGYALDIEVDINAGLPSYEIVGLPDASVKESKERIRSAIKNSGFNYPVKKITVNMAPADSKKEGPVYDLPIAVGLLVASGQLEIGIYKDYVIVGELSLDGSIRHVNGIIALIIAARAAGYKKFILPYDNMTEASYIQDIEVYCARTLNEVFEHLSAAKPILPVVYKEYKAEENNYKACGDFSEVKGQYSAKRALEIAVSGGHNVLMIGPPGAGKSMLAKCVPGIMPDMTFDEALEITKIHSVAGMLDSKTGIMTRRPFRSPHHTTTSAALVGGTKDCRPGEISLAHNGVLFLDEMPEYSRKNIETLRQPIEDGTVVVARASGSVEYPANVMLIASMNPCPCGNYGSRKQICTCSSSQVHKYLSKMSGPIMDRIDIHIEVDSIEYEQLRDKAQGESSAVIKQRIEKARDIQRRRFASEGIYTNSGMNNKLIRMHCEIDGESEKLLEAAFKKLNLSARASSRILKVARTIADIEGNEKITSAHIAEAIQYRSLDRKYIV